MPCCPLDSGIVFSLRLLEPQFKLLLFWIWKSDAKTRGALGSQRFSRWRLQTMIWKNQIFICGLIKWGRCSITSLECQRGLRMQVWSLTTFVVISDRMLQIALRKYLANRCSARGEGVRELRCYFINCEKLLARHYLCSLLEAPSIFLDFRWYVRMYPYYKDWFYADARARGGAPRYIISGKQNSLEEKRMQREQKNDEQCEIRQLTEVNTFQKK